MLNGQLPCLTGDLFTPNNKNSQKKSENKNLFLSKNIFVEIEKGTQINFPMPPKTEKGKFNTFIAINRNLFNTVRRSQ